MPDALDATAAFAAMDGRYPEAARVCGAVERLRRDSGIVMRYAVTQPTIDAALEGARSSLGPRFDQGSARGAARSLPEALDLASELLR